MSSARKILHVDLDAFFCAVEELHNPNLKGKPFAVGGRPEERGVVASCSYAARQYGVRSAMPMGRAIGLCPGLLILPSRHQEYGRISQQVMDLLNELTPLLEQLSIDEAFLDVSELQEPILEIACRLQEQIAARLGLPASIGAASNKLVAKIANDAGKAARRSAEPPRAVTVVPPGEEASFLAPLPLQALWGIGPKTSERLEALGLRTIGQLAQLPEWELSGLLGKTGRDIVLRARGIDDRPVETTHTIKSISQETTFVKDIHDRHTLELTLRQHSERVGNRLRADSLTGNTIKLKLRWPDFTTLTRQVTLPEATDQDDDIFQVALRLFHKVWKDGRPVRLLGVGVSGLHPPIRQLGLWDKPREKDRQIQKTVDLLRERYGRAAIRRGALSAAEAAAKKTDQENPT